MTDGGAGARNGRLLIGSVYGDEIGKTHPDRENGNAEQFPFYEDRNTARYGGDEGKRIHIRRMVRCENADSRRNVLEACGAAADPAEPIAEADTFHGHSVHEVGAPPKNAPKNQPRQHDNDAQDKEQEHDRGADHEIDDLAVEGGPTLSGRQSTPSMASARAMTALG